MFSKNKKCSNKIHFEKPFGTNRGLVLQLLAIVRRDVLTEFARRYWLDSQQLVSRAKCIVMC